MSILLDATEYTFQGDGITASFFPRGAGGPVIEGRPETFFVYQDHHLSKTFGQAGVDIQQINNVGALVSVVLVESPISGGPVTTFTVLVPSVGVTEGSPQSFKNQVGYHGSSGHLGGEASIPGASDLQGGAP